MKHVVQVALLCALVSIGLSSFASAQSSGVNARLSSTVVKLGGDTKLVIEVENAHDASLGALPTVPGLRFGPVGSPAVQQYFSISNGRQTQSRTLTWVISVQPTQKGEFTIPPIELDVSGRRFATRELSLKAVEDIQGDEFGLFEIDAPKEVVEGQPFTVEMRFGWDSSLTRQINYAKLTVPWLSGMAGLLELDPPPFAAGMQTTALVLNDRSRITAEQIGEQKVGGRSFFVLRSRKRFVATRSGPLELPTSDFEFGRAAQEGFFSRPEPAVSYYKRSPAPVIDVQKLPTEGQPVDFSGAVGAFEAKATADRRRVVAGESIKLTVDWSGSGNLEFFAPPDIGRVDTFRGFRVYGSNDVKSLDRRSVTYDIAPLSADVREIPSVPLSVYDLATKSYKTIRTQPIGIEVSPLANAAPLGEEAGTRDLQVDIRDIQTRTALGGCAHGPGSGVLTAVGGLVLGGWLALRSAVRRRGDPSSARAKARRRARAVLARELAAARSASDEARALRTFLAARTGDPAEAWVGRDLAAWAARRAEAGAGEITELPALDELRALMSRLDERTWNGSDERIGAAAITTIADRLLAGGL